MVSIGGLLRSIVGVGWLTGFYIWGMCFWVMSACLLVSSPAPFSLDPLSMESGRPFVRPVELNLHTVLFPALLICFPYLCTPFLPFFSLVHDIEP